MQGRWNVFQFLTRTLMTLCKTRTQFVDYLQGFHIIAISENSSKYDISDSKEDTDLGVPLQQIWMLQANKFSKKRSTKVLFSVLQFFSELTR